MWWRSTRRIDDKLVICHVGDSRAYRLRHGEFALLTNDHSWVHEQVTAGFLTEEAARNHPLKNVVTQALGGTSEPRVDVLETELQDGDLFLLCSDGLNSMLTDDEIAGLLEPNGPLQESCERLINAANQRGGNDNISVVLLRSRREAGPESELDRATLGGRGESSIPFPAVMGSILGIPAGPAEVDDDRRQ